MTIFVFKNENLWEKQHENINIRLKNTLKLKKNSLEKYEYHAGEIFAMAGGTLNHSLLSTNSKYRVKKFWFLNDLYGTCVLNLWKLTLNYY